MKKILVLIGLVSLAGCTEVKDNVAICKRLADGYLNAQSGAYHYLVSEPRKKGETTRLFYRVEQSYKMTQTETKDFECIEQSEGVWLNLLENGVAKTVAMLPTQKEPA